MRANRPLTDLRQTVAPSSGMHHRTDRLRLVAPLSGIHRSSDFTKGLPRYRGYTRDHRSYVSFFEVCPDVGDVPPRAMFTMSALLSGIYHEDGLNANLPRHRGYTPRAFSVGSYQDVSPAIGDAPKEHSVARLAPSSGIHPSASTYAKHCLPRTRGDLPKTTKALYLAHRRELTPERARSFR